MPFWNPKNVGGGFLSSSGLTNYVLNPGYTFQNFSDASNWTVGNGTKGAALSSGGVTVTPSAVNTTATLDKSLSNYDVSGVTTMTVEFYVPDRTGVAEFNVLLSNSTSSGSINGSRLMFQTLQADIVNGLNRLTIHKDYATANGTPTLTFSDLMKWVRIQVKSSASGTTGVTIRNITFNQVNKAIAIVQFDDFYSGFYTDFWPTFQAKTQNGAQPKGSLACQSTVIGNAGSMTGAQIQAMYADGWDVVTHASTHVDYTTLTDPQILQQIDDQRTALTALGIPNSQCHAYTNGAYNSSVIADLASKGIIHARTSDDGLQSHENRNYMNIRSTAKSSSTVFANLQTRIDKCVKNGMLYFTYSHNDYQQTKLSQELDYLIANNVTIMTHSKYIAGLTFTAQPT